MKTPQIMMIAAIAALAGCATAPCCKSKACCKPCYPDAPKENFFSLFDGETFLNFEGDVSAFTFERNPVVGTRGRGKNAYTFCSDANAIVFKPAPDGKPKKIYTKEKYDNFILRFEYLAETNAWGAVGLRTPVNACPCKDGVMVALADDFGFEKTDRAADKFSGSITGFQASRREPNIRLDWKHESGNTYAKPAGRWNFMEVRALGDTVTTFLNGEKVAEAKIANRPANGRIVFVGGDKTMKWMRPRVKRVAADWRADACPCLNKAPEGFTSLFDGKTLANWKGVTTEEKFDRPWVRQAATPAKRAEMQKKADELMRQFWSVREGALFFDGKKGGYSLATMKDYGDFELWCDWRLQNVQGDSGLYPRGVCQIQIWDAHNMWHLGSGGLYNNKENPRHAMEIADFNVGDWNRFHVKMVGKRITVWLNGRLVVENTLLENANLKNFPGTEVPDREQLELQCHGDPLEFRDIFIREL